MKEEETMDNFPFTHEDEAAKPKKTARKAKGQNVKPGSQVLFVLDDSTHPGDIRPAIVVAKSDEHAVEKPLIEGKEEEEEQEEELSRADLHVFAGPKDYPAGHHRAGAHHRTDVRYDAAKSPNSWHWSE